MSMQRNGRLTLVSVLGTLAVLGKVMTVSACLRASLTPKTAFERADEVFRGVVERFEKSVPNEPQLLVEPEKVVHRRSATFRVKEAWKGAFPQPHQIVTGLSQDDCGCDFVVGREYLVYAKGGYTDFCMRTRAIEKAIEDLQFLGALRDAATNKDAEGQKDASDPGHAAPITPIAPRALDVDEAECWQHPEYLPIGSMLKKWVGPKEDPWKNAHEVESFMFERCIERPVAYRHCEHLNFTC